MTRTSQWVKRSFSCETLGFILAELFHDASMPLSHLRSWKHLSKSALVSNWRTLKRCWCPEHVRSEHCVRFMEFNRFLWLSEHRGPSEIIHVNTHSWCWSVMFPLRVFAVHFTLPQTNKGEKTPRSNCFLCLVSDFQLIPVVAETADVRCVCDRRSRFSISSSVKITVAFLNMASHFYIVCVDNFIWRSFL